MEVQMKKAILLLALILMVSAFGGCSKNNKLAGTGEATDLSKLFLSKGYAVNIYRSSMPLGTDADSLGKSYVTMTFGILAEWTSTADYDPAAGYNIKKITVTN